MTTTAPAILQAGIDAMADRAATRDADAERSMARAVATFNSLTGAALTEVDGWQFMECLKMARSRGGGHNPDDYVDGAAYAALAGEAAAHEADFEARPLDRTLDEIQREHDRAISRVQQVTTEARDDLRRAISAGSPR